MDTAVVAVSTVLIAVSALFIIALCISSPPSFRLAIKNMRARKKSTAVAIMSLSIVTAVITSSFCIGDSVRYSMDTNILDNLGDVDIVVQSHGLFDLKFYDAVEKDSVLAGMCEKTAPALILTASAVCNSTGQRASSVSLLGITDEFLNFGTFQHPDGKRLGFDADDINESVVIINTAVAGELGVKKGDWIDVYAVNPDNSIESVFSVNAKTVEIRLKVIEITETSGLGRFSLGTSAKAKNIYLSLTGLQKAVSCGNRINTILVDCAGETDDYNTVQSQTDDVIERLGSVLDDAASYEDAGFIVSITDHLRIDNRNVFFSDKHLRTAQDICSSGKSGPDSMVAVSPLCTYFVYALEHNGIFVPYSTVAGFDPESDGVFGQFTDNATGAGIDVKLTEDEIIITNYTAIKLGGLRTGSTINMTYEIIDSAYKVRTVTHRFRVKYVIDMEGKAKDKGIPPFPGISGKSCYEWDPEIYEINRSMLRSFFDLDYWQTWGGAPKAYISLETAGHLWGNDLGRLTTLKIKPADGADIYRASANFLDDFNASIAYSDAGIILRSIKAEYLKSSSGAFLLTGTFLAFGSVVVASSFVVSAFFISASVEGRRREIGIARAVGMTSGSVGVSLSIEYGLTSVFSCIAGIFLGIGVAFASVFLINEFAPQVVEGIVVFHHEPVSLLVAFSSALILCMVLVSVSAQYIARGTRGSITAYLLARPGADAGQSTRHKRSISAKLQPRTKAIMFLLFAVIAFTAAYSFRDYAGLDVVALFLSVGFAVVIFSSAAAVSLLEFLAGGDFQAMMRRPLAGISLKNITRRRKSAFGTIAATALVVFTVLSLSAYAASREASPSELAERQGGGYHILAETAVPLMFDAGNSSQRENKGVTNDGFPAVSETIQFLSFGPEGGKCTNLRNTIPPRLIGMNVTFAENNRLGFYATPPDCGKNVNDAWKLLDRSKYGQPDTGDHDSGNDYAIPAIGDYNTVVWILGKNIGGIVEVQDENGEPVKLRIAAILENTVFQGMLFVSEKNIRAIYPTKAQYTMLLFKTIHDAGDESAVMGTANALERAFFAYGLDAKPIVELARANTAVDYAYISMFQALTVAGLMLGLGGISAIAIRNIRERRYEIGVLRAIGLRRGDIARLVFNEYVATVSIGLFIGVSASVALSGMVSANPEPHLQTALFVSTAVLLSACASALYPSAAASRSRPADSLREID